MEIGFLGENACGSCFFSNSQKRSKKSPVSVQCSFALLSRFAQSQPLPPSLSTHSPREESIEFHVIKSLIITLEWLPLTQFPGGFKNILFKLAKIRL